MFDLHPFSMPSAQVITIGHATTDIFLVSQAFHPTQHVETPDLCVLLGGKIDIDGLTVSSGGGAVNAAVTFASLHYRTACLVKLGQHLLARGLIKDLSDAGVSTRLVVPGKADPPDLSVILTLPAGERTVLRSKQPQNTLRASEIPWKKLKADLFYLTSMGGDRTLIKRLVHHACLQSAHVIWNPGENEYTQGIDVFRHLLPSLSVCFLNLEEARLFLRLRTGDAPELALALCKKGLPLAIVTDGPRGAWAATVSGELLHAKPRGLPSKSRTGAGDAFGSGVAAALLKGLSLPDMLRVGMCNAESVIQAFGAHTRVLTRWPTRRELSRIVVTHLR